MVIDSSIILAIMLEEPKAREYARGILEAPVRVISAASFVECGLRLTNLRGELGLPQLEVFLMRSRIEVVSLDEEQARIAVRAFEKYGKGRHPAGLNYGDCLFYALAKVRREPLFYQGNDFSQTDLA